MNKRIVVMVRHGESVFNQKNLFCGWYDAELSELGIKEASKAGETLCSLGYKFDVAHVSVLQRAQRTLAEIKEGLCQQDIPTCSSWRLNERHYGALTGLNKAETAAKYGEDQVKIWRRSFDVPPPPMGQDHPYYSSIVNSPIYAKEPPKSEFPMFESLKLTIDRTLPYWNESIVPDLKAGKKVIIVAHGNSLRGLVKHLDCLTDEQIMEVNLPTAVPFLYELDDNMRPLAPMRYLGDEEEIKKKIEGVAAQGKKK